MKLLTINVHSWLEEDQEEKMDILAKTIAQKGYDLVALQEVSQLKNSKVVYDEVKEDNYGLLLLEKIKSYTAEKYSYYWANSHIGYDKLDEGLAFITKHKIKNIEDFYCTNSQTIYSISSRKIIKVQLENIDAEFYCCHMNLPWAEDENMQDNLTTILNYSNSSKLKVLMGDFNTDALNDKEAYENILNLNLYDTYTLAKEKDDGITVCKNIAGWDDSHGKKRLDYIFTTKKVEVEKSNVIFNGENEPVISDHYGVEIELTL